MLTKFDSKSSRVKGLSFHPQRPWILASLHTGTIQLWDYRMGVLLDKFEEHEGPVRGIDFHQQQPLFVSGGDDYKIKVWNYKLRRCLFTLLGHLDYIRTVQFHHEYPWIVSASDDQTIRIWNWQARSCVSVLTGHNHYVMSAQFHPKDDLVVSASLDQTVRVWDTSGLRKKTVRGGPPSLDGRANSQDIFGVNDTVVKYVLEGHDRGVNWASFHPTRPLIVSGADDRTVRLWRMDFSKAWEVDTLRGHTNNVSCAIFHPKHELIISNSEDRSIRVWDAQKRIALHTYRRENDRFWVLAAHPTQNVLACGHDGGMVVFKLERERPAYFGGNGQAFYTKERFLRRAVLGAGTDVPVLSLRRYAGEFNFNALPREVIVNEFNPGEDNVIVFSLAEGGMYDLYNLNQEGSEPVHGDAISVAFVGRSRFVTLGKDHSMTLRDLAGTAIKRIPAPYPNADYVYAAGATGRVLVRAQDRICLFETASRRTLHELHGVSVRTIAWSPDHAYVALMGKHVVVIANRELKQVCTVTETVRVKGGVWDERGILVYVTLNHVKYLIPGQQADSGIIRTLENPVYPVEARDSVLYCLDRAVSLRALKIDMTECLFKQALANHQYKQVLKIIKSARLCGKAVIAYLRKAGYPEVALHFVEDSKSKFNLALECGQLDVAYDSAEVLQEANVWRRLAQSALKHGRLDLVEKSYKNGGDTHHLSFLRVVSGQLDKLRQEEHEKPLNAGDPSALMARFQNALLLGDAKMRVQILLKSGQLALAYACAATHGLEEDAAKLRGYLEDANLPVPDLPSASDGKYGVLLAPPIPVSSGKDWPRIQTSKPIWETSEEEIAEVSPMTREALGDIPTPQMPTHVDGLANADNAWGGDLDLDLGESTQHGHDVTGNGLSPGDAWGDDLDLNLDDEMLQEDDAVAAGEDISADISAEFVPPAAGTSPQVQWSNHSLAVDHVAAGSFKTAMDLLHRQLGIVNFAPLRDAFFSVFYGANAHAPVLPSVSDMRLPLFRSRSDSDSAPRVPFRLATLKQKMQEVYRSFEAGQFSAAEELLSKLFALLPLAVCDSDSEVNEAKALVGIMTEYKTAVMLESTRKAIDASNAVRQLELAAYLTHCSLQPKHLLLTLHLAMSLAFKLKNFINAASFAKRLLELPDAQSPANQQLNLKARKVIALAEKQGRNEHKLDYDEATPFTVCCASMTPLYHGQAYVRSPYSGAMYKPEHKGELCRVDGLSKIGEETLGLVLKA